MKVSVVVPSYRPGEYLWECLGSLAGQTFAKENFEVIVVLNGCNEPFYGQISHYIAEHMKECNVTLLQTDEAGVSHARNIGIERSQGEYLAFVDDDDYVSPTYLQELYDVALEGFVPLSNILAFNDGEEGIVPYYISDLFQKRKDQERCTVNEVRSFLSVPYVKLLSKEIIGNRRFDPNFRLGEDSLFIFTISDKMNTFKCTSASAVYYRRYREGSAVKRRYTVGEVLGNTMRLCWAYTRVYLSNPINYNLLFYLSRIAGTILTSKKILKTN
ncbi:MAG: glycosyltransferase family 2 protein [Muribaculaceae bacterium]|nr:glycosyltransferase family 2 protein [Muribaculaceae bacterium]